MSYTAKDYDILIDMFRSRARISGRLEESPEHTLHHLRNRDLVIHAALMCEALEAADIRSDGDWFTIRNPGARHCAEPVCNCGIPPRIPLPRNERKEEGK